MVDSSKFANFTERAKQNIDQIKIGLLKHDRNPQDREFLNDISRSVHSIKNAALPIGLSRITELCHNLENLINLIKEEKKELYQEIIITFASCRDRLTKFVFELETIGSERSKVKDLITRIQKHIDDYNNAEVAETVATHSGPDSIEAKASGPVRKRVSSLLPEEILKKEYDEELFKIFIEQVQENISLLRSLTDSFADEPNKDRVITQCSNLVGKLQSSANYMGYEQLAEFYLQWIAELEMAGVELSMGTPTSFDFMDREIKKIADLFPNIEDKPADPAELRKVGKTSSPPPQAVEPEEDEFTDDSEEFREMFSSMDGLEDEEFDDDIEPIAALSDVSSFDEEERATEVADQKPSQEKRKSRARKTIEIDASFLEEEKESEDYDEELFQIFVQQLQENISQLQKLTDSFPSEPNKANVIDTCSNLVGKLQSSANYMGYERLAEFHLQWIAELEMTGVELSIGSDITFDFMQEKINRIAALFQQAEGASVASPSVIKTEKAPLPEPVAEPVKIIETVPEITTPAEPAMEIAAEEEPAVREEEGSEFSDALDEKLETFFTDIEGPEAEEELATSFMKAAALSEEEPEEESITFTAEPPAATVPEDLFEDAEGEEEPLAEGIEPIAGISDEEVTGPEEAALALFDEEPVAEADKEKGGEFSEAVDEKLETFFTDIEEPEAEEELATSFMEAASLSEEEPEEEPITFTAEPPAATVPEDLFEELEEKVVDPIAESMIEDIDAFFEEEEPTAEIPCEEPSEEIALATEEVTEDIDAAFMEKEVIEAEKAVTNAPAGDIEALIQEEGPLEEKIEDVVPFVEEITEEEEAIAALPEEILTDEELLQEIEGPTVGEALITDSESLLPDIEIAEETISAISEEQLSEEELFKKLEGAISADKEVTGDTDDLVTDEEILDESEITAEMPETAPERRELFQKLTHALQSLEEETEDLEAVAEVEAEGPEPEQEFDNQLFDRLARALETPSEYTEIKQAGPIDHVLEEMLSTTPVEAKHVKPFDYSIPKKLAASEIKQIIRMDKDKVDHLMDHVSELNTNRATLAQVFAEMNNLHQHYLEVDGFNNQELKPLKELIFRLGDTSVSLNRLSSEIRESGLKVRLVPINLLLDRYHEFVNDLASRGNKRVEIEIAGEETELEKTVIDEISEPLTHIVGNAVEHGIETINERKDLGKDETGKIKLEAYNENNEIVIEVIDDGRGIDLKKVKARALKKGLLTGDELYKMSESDLKRLILDPDFSTVADVAGKPEDRGQGLHIVNTNIEKLKGSIDIRSKAGKGTIIQLRVPLDLVIIKALKIRAGAEIMALPVSCVNEILKVPREDIHQQDGKKTITINDMTMPVFRLTEIFNIESVESQDKRVYIIIVEAEGQSIGLIVDETAGLEEIVIKPLGEFLRKESGFSGATILSDGKISLIPDIAELIRIATEHLGVPEESIA